MSYTPNIPNTPNTLKKNNDGPPVGSMHLPFAERRMAMSEVAKTHVINVGAHGPDTLVGGHTYVFAQASERAEQVSGRASARSSTLTPIYQAVPPRNVSATLAAEHNTDLLSPDLYTSADMFAPDHAAFTPDNRRLESGTLDKLVTRTET